MASATWMRPPPCSDPLQTCRRPLSPIASPLTRPLTPSRSQPRGPPAPSRSVSTRSAGGRPAWVSTAGESSYTPTAISPIAKGAVVYSRSAGRGRTDDWDRSRCHWDAGTGRQAPPAFGRLAGEHGDGHGRQQSEPVSDRGVDRRSRQRRGAAPGVGADLVVVRPAGLDGTDLDVA